MNINNIYLIIQLQEPLSTINNKGNLTTDEESNIKLTWCLILELLLSLSL